MAAGLGFKTFATGEVLTAADTNGYLMQGVNVFANAAARTAAITSPQEGQMSYLKDTDETQYYTGSAWVSVGGASGLNLVSTTTIGTAVSTVSVNNVFTSAYSNYKVIIEWVGSSASTNLNFRLRASGTDNSAANSYQPRGFSNLASTVASFGSAGAQMQIGSIVNNDYDITSMEVFRPQIAANTTFAVNHYEGSNNSAYMFMGMHFAATSFDGFTVYPTTGTLTNGTIYVYGYGK